MPRHSFIQMSKLPNVKGRISYITSHARQENLYATYRTADSTFWSNLARESQQEFQRSGTEGKCIEARELIIALPEIYTQYEPQQVLTDFTEEFRRRYGVECVSALHHNKRKTNYHIHLIFSERRLLPEPDVKVASRSVFFDETGKRVRTKKEITGEDGQITPIIKERTTPSKAPFASRASAIGIVPKISAYIGIPTIVAIITPNGLLSPSALTINSSGIQL